MLGVVTYWLPVLICFKNILFLRGNLLCFIVSLIIIFSGQSKIPDFSNKVLTWLGKLSMPLYVWHMAIKTVIQVYFYQLPMNKQVCIFWVGSFAAAIINMVLVDRANAKRREKAK